MVNGGGCSNEEGMRLVLDVFLGMQIDETASRGIPRRILLTLTDCTDMDSAQEKGKKKRERKEKGHTILR